MSDILPLAGESPASLVAVVVSLVGLVVVIVRWVLARSTEDRADLRQTTAERIAALEAELKIERSQCDAMQGALDRIRSEWASERRAWEAERTALLTLLGERNTGR